MGEKTPQKLTIISPCQIDGHFFNLIYHTSVNFGFCCICLKSSWTAKLIKPEHTFLFTYINEERFVFAIENFSDIL